MVSSGVVDVSPDRTELLLCRAVELDSVTACELWAAPLLGGSARRLGDLVAQGGAAAWSPNGQQVVYARNGELHIARRDGTEIRKLATIPVTPFWVRWSPDGSRVRFSVDPGTGPDDTSLWEAGIDGKRAYPLLPGWAACCGNWTPDGKYFVFQVASEPYDSVWILREKAGRFQRTERGPFQLGPTTQSTPADLSL
jgi:Tol biopolymer transport system component